MYSLEYTQISLRIRVVWPAPLLCALRIARVSNNLYLWSDCADAQADLSIRWAHMYTYVKIVGIAVPLIYTDFPGKGRKHEGQPSRRNYEEQTSNMRKRIFLHCVPIEDSNHPAHPRRLIWVFVVRTMRPCILGLCECTGWAKSSLGAHIQRDIFCRWSSVSGKIQ